MPRWALFADLNPRRQHESTPTKSSGNQQPRPHQRGIRLAAPLQGGSTVNLHVPSSLMANDKPAEQALCQTGKGEM
jgi:hypothetical protein